VDFESFINRINAFHPDNDLTYKNAVSIQ